jgi:hypothetical protein
MTIKHSGHFIQTKNSILRLQSLKIFLTFIYIEYIPRLRISCNVFLSLLVMLQNLYKKKMAILVIRTVPFTAPATVATHGTAPVR